MKKVAIQGMVAAVATFLILTGMSVSVSHSQGGSSSGLDSGELMLSGLDSPEDSLHRFIYFVTSTVAVYANDRFAEIWEKTPIQYAGRRKPKCHFMGIAFGTPRADGYHYYAQTAKRTVLSL